MVQRANLTLNVNEQVEFQITFCSDRHLSVKVKISLQVKDNQQSDTTIQVRRDTYQEIVSLENISRSWIRKMMKKV